VTGNSPRIVVDVNYSLNVIDFNRHCASIGGYDFHSDPECNLTGLLEGLIQNMLLGDVDMARLWTHLIELDAEVSETMHAEFVASHPNHPGATSILLYTNDSLLKNPRCKKVHITFLVLILI
jgi:hypothetical protein